jgi:hypothetical protein
MVYSMRTNPAQAIVVNVELVRPLSFSSSLNVAGAVNACRYLDALGIRVGIQGVANVNREFTFAIIHRASKTQLLHDEDEDQG